MNLLFLSKNHKHSCLLFSFFNIKNNNNNKDNEIKLLLKKLEVLEKENLKLRLKAASHLEIMCRSVESILAHLRTNYWIVRGRKTVKNLLYKCTICKRYQGKTITPPASPDLPDFRLSFNAFNATGLDYAGPLNV